MVSTRGKSATPLPERRVQGVPSVIPHRRPCGEELAGEDDRGGEIAGIQREVPRLLFAITDSQLFLVADQVLEGVNEPRDDQ